MLNDPIVDEVRQARQLYAAKFDFDLEAICKDLKQQEAASNLKLVAFPPKNNAKRVRIKAKNKSPLSYLSNRRLCSTN